MSIFTKLLKKFKECRAKGYRISFTWLWSSAKMIYRKQLCDESTTIRPLVIINPIKRQNFRMKKKQQSKKISKEDIQAKIQE